MSTLYNNILKSKEWLNGKRFIHIVDSLNYYDSIGFKFINEKYVLIGNNNFNDFNIDHCVELSQLGLLTISAQTSDVDILIKKKTDSDINILEKQIRRSININKLIDE